MFRDLLIANAVKSVDKWSDLGYYTTGLTTALDGQFNASDTEHSSSVSSWFNHGSGGNVALSGGAYTWAGDHLTITSALTGREIGTTSFTLEVCYKRVSGAVASAAASAFIVSFDDRAVIRNYDNGTKWEYYGAPDDWTTPHTLTVAYFGKGEICSVYLDGVLAVSTTISSKAWNADHVSLFGRISPNGNTEFFRGDIYAVRHYNNRRLSASQVAANYAIDKERFGL